MGILNHRFVFSSKSGYKYFFVYFHVTDRDLIPGEDSDFSFRHNAQTSFLDNQASNPAETEGSFPSGKSPGA
jgi:hypothetical protein